MGSSICRLGYRWADKPIIQSADTDQKVLQIQANDCLLHVWMTLKWGGEPQTVNVTDCFYFFSSSEELECTWKICNVTKIMFKMWIDTYCNFNNSQFKLKKVCLHTAHLPSLLDTFKKFHTNVYHLRTSQFIFNETPCGPAIVVFATCWFYLKGWGHLWC